MPDTESDTDLVAVEHPHPDNAGVHIVSRGAARVMADSGWRIAKSPEAKAALAETERLAPADDATTTNTKGSRK